MDVKVGSRQEEAAAATLATPAPAAPEAADEVAGDGFRRA